MMELMAVAEQMVCKAGVVLIIAGVGFTVTEAVTGVPVHPFAVGVMVNVTVIGTVLLLVKMPEIFPVPLAAIPDTESVLFLVQLYKVPAACPVKVMGIILEPEQIVCVAGVGVAVTFGFTSTVAVTGVPSQVLALGVTVNFTSTGAAALFTNVPLIGAMLVAVPEVRIVPPTSGLSRTHVYVVEVSELVNEILEIPTLVQVVCEAGVITVPMLER